MSFDKASQLVQNLKARGVQVDPILERDLLSGERGSAARVRKLIDEHTPRMLVEDMRVEADYLINTKLARVMWRGGGD